MATGGMRASLSVNILDETLLRQYLPQDVVAALRGTGPGLAPEALTPHIHRLSTLLQTIATYIPADIVDDQMRRPTRGRVKGAFHNGTLLYADVSGFTAMSEKLGALGRVGAEELTRVVNGLFTTLLAAANRQGGVLLKFAGDAVIVFFSGPDHAPRAVRAALTMQRVMRWFRGVKTLAGVFTLRMTVGLHAGDFFRAEVGSQERVEPIITGRDVNRTAQVQGQAAPGQVLVSAETYEQAAHWLTATPHGQGCFLVTDMKRGPIQVPRPEPWVERRKQPVRVLRALIERIDAMRPYLVGGLYNKIAASPGETQVEGELRPATVLFANFGDFGALLQEAGPEMSGPVAAHLNTYYSRMQEIIHRYGGTVNKVNISPRGDALMAIFGAPVAHEDDPARAVLAALEMQAAVDEMNKSRSEDLPTATSLIRQRIGINTGHVFAGNVGASRRKEYTVMGDAVNLAQRVMSVAREGQVLVSDATWRKVSGNVEGEDLPPIWLKGKTAPIAVHSVHKALQKPRLERQRTAAPWQRNRVVGREAEIATLRAVAEDALFGKGQAVGICGDAGSGKSRLVDEIAGYAAGVVWPVAILSGECLSYGQSVAYLPFITVLRHYFGLADGAEPKRAAQSVLQSVGERAGDQARFAPLLGSLLALPIPENEVTRSLTPQRRRQQTMELVRTLLYSEARRQPLVMIVEDLQWIDDSSQALLDLLLQDISDVPLFLVLTYRPDFKPPWRKLPQFVEVVLKELSEAGSLALIASLLSSPALPEKLQRMILDKAQGNPLFLEEVLKSLVETGVIARKGGQWVAGQELDVAAIPDTVQAVILARLDRLEEGSRHAAQVASVIGRRFRYLILQRVHPQPEGLQERLEDLSAVDLILAEEHGLDQVYLFKNVLTQEVAYESLLYARRREFHGKIASCIAQLYRERLHEQLEVLAMHTLRAEEWDASLDYHLRAGKKLQGLYANQDAIGYFSKALEIADKAQGDATVQRAEAHELRGDVQFVLGRNDAASESYHSARHLLAERYATGAASPDRLAAIFRKIGAVHERKGEFARAREWYNQGLGLVHKPQESIEAARACGAMASCLYREGNHGEARPWAERAMSIAEQLSSESDTAHFYNLLGTISQSLGEPENALQYRRRSLEMYQMLGDLSGQAAAHNNLGVALSNSGRWAEAMPHYEKSLELRARIEDAAGQATVLNNIGQDLFGIGDLGQARQSYERALEIFRRIGHPLGVAVTQDNLGKVFLALHDWAQAERFLTESLTGLEKIASRAYLPEVYRHLAELALGQYRWAEASAYAASSLEMALELGARQEEGITRRVLAQVETALGNEQQARLLLEESLLVLKEVRNEYERGKTLLQLAMLEERTSIPGEAAVAAKRQEAITIFKRLGAQRDLALAAG